MREVHARNGGNMTGRGPYSADRCAVAENARVTGKGGGGGDADAGGGEAVKGEVVEGGM